MSAIDELRAMGQSLWLDNITRELLDDGTLQRYITEYGITGLTSNPSIFQKAISGSDAYREAIRASTAADAEALFFELALADLRRAADLFAPAFQRSGGADGWVSLEVSPRIADDAAAQADAARRLHSAGQRANLFIKIPGTPAGCAAIEEAVFAGVPINVTLLFSSAQTIAAAEAWARGIERRLAAGLEPGVRSVLSLFVSRWDVAVAAAVPAALHNRLGIAVAEDTLAAYRALCASPRWQALADHGVAPQRLLWASTSTKDPQAPDTLYVTALAAPDTINTLPDKTLAAAAAHGALHGPMASDGVASARTLAEFRAAGVDLDALAERLQRDGAAAFVKSWTALLAELDARRGAA